MSSELAVYNISFIIQTLPENDFSSDNFQTFIYEIHTKILNSTVGSFCRCQCYIIISSTAGYIHYQSLENDVTWIFFSYSIIHKSQAHLFTTTEFHAQYSMYQKKRDMKKSAMKTIAFFSTPSRFKPQRVNEKKSKICRR